MRLCAEDHGNCRCSCSALTHTMSLDDDYRLLWPHVTDPVSSGAVLLLQCVLRYVSRAWTHMDFMSLCTSSSLFGSG